MHGALRALGRKANRRTDKFVQNKVGPVEKGISFSDLARMAWPEHTESFLAEILHCDPKTCKRWLEDNNEPPADAAMLVINEITRQYLTRSR